jgi:hypothetical protein
MEFVRKTNPTDGLVWAMISPVLKGQVPNMGKTDDGYYYIPPRDIFEMMSCVTLMCVYQSLDRLSKEGYINRMKVGKLWFYRLGERAV